MQCQSCGKECAVDDDEIYLEMTAKWVIHTDCIDWLPNDRTYEFIHIDDYLKYAEPEASDC